MRIAIVGAGISGLTAAYMLNGSHEISVFEADDRIGGHAHTVRVDTHDHTYQLDTGFMVFNDRNYPNFEALLRRLGVATQPSEMSFSVSNESGTFEYSSRSLNALFADRRHVLSRSFQRMLADVPRFQRAALELLNADDDRLSLRAWLEKERFSPQFVERLIVPQAAAVWSADPRQLWTFPALFLARFFHNHGMLSLRDRPAWSTVSGGSATYVARLSDGFRGRIHLRSPVQSITRDERGVRLRVRGAEPLRFDRVVIATHSDQALAMLTDATTREREVLGAIPYQQNEAVLHTDASVLPRRRRAWASWNYHLVPEPSARTTVTYHLNRLQRLVGEQQFCVTLNLGERVDPARVIRRINFAHPVYTPAGVAAQRRLSEISGRDGGHTHFCGAYWGWGFHEDGVSSGLEAAKSFGANL